MIIKHTVAAILAASYEDLIVDEIELPKSLESGQVLVRVISSGICGAQLNEIDAIKGVDVFLPHLLGHEGFCEVIEVARDVSRVKVGDQAVMHWRKGFGINSNTPRYKWKGMNLNAGWITTLNEHAVISENRLTRVNTIKNLPPNILPLLGCALTTAYGVVTNEIPFNPQDSIVIFGVGGVGLSLVAVIKALQDRKVIVVDREVKRLESALALGANQTVLFKSKEQCRNELLKLLKGSRAEIAIETTGDTQCIELAYEETQESGVVILVGVPNSKQKISLYTLPLHYGKILKGSDGGSSNPDTDIPFLIDLLSRGILRLESYPIRVFSLVEVNEAIKAIRGGQPGRSIIQF